MKQPIQEYTKYTALLSTVFPKESKEPEEPKEPKESKEPKGPKVAVKAIRIHNPDDTYNLRLHVENNGKLDPPLEFPIDDMRTKITKIKNFSANFNGVEIGEIIVGINNFMQKSPIPTLDAADKIGWHYDTSDSVIYWKSATAIDLHGNPLPKDIFAPYPSYNGNLQDNIAFISEYISKHGAVAQSILLYGFSSVLAGYFHKNLLLSLSGKSSRGKTTISKLIISLFAEPENGKLSKTFNVTLNKMAESLNGINGAAVLIDDLSLAPSAIKKDIDGMVYVLESGKEKERMRTKSFDRDPSKWCTTIIFSAEEPLLSLCNPEQEGAVGRLMELDISSDDLFTDATEANQIADLSHKHYGLLADEFVKRLITNNMLEELPNLYEKEIERVKADYSGVLARVAQNVAIITLCAQLLKKLFSFNFNIPSIESFLMSTASENLDNFRISQKGNVIMKSIYPKLVDYAKQSCPDENKGLTDHVVISSKATKAMLAELQKDYGYKPIEVKRALKEGGVLSANDGPYSYVGTINGKSFRGLYLYIKDIKETTTDE